MTNDYTPIACRAYDELEVLAMHRQSVTVSLVTDSRVTGIACDMAIHDGAEFLVLEVGAQRQELRLDQIAQIMDTAGKVVWCQKTGKHEYR